MASQLASFGVGFLNDRTGKNLLSPLEKKLKIYLYLPHYYKLEVIERGAEYALSCLFLYNRKDNVRYCGAVWMPFIKIQSADNGKMDFINKLS